MMNLVLKFSSLLHIFICLLQRLHKTVEPHKLVLGDTMQYRREKKQTNNLIYILYFIRCDGHYAVCFFPCPTHPKKSDVQFNPAHTNLDFYSALSQMVDLNAILDISNLVVL